MTIRNGKKEPWRETTLESIAELVMGQSPPSSTYNEEGLGLPFFQGTRDFNYMHPTPRVYCSAPTRIADPGDILLSIRAPIGRVNIADRRCAIGRGLAIIRPKPQVDTRFVEFLLRQMEPTWNAMNESGTVFGNATKRDLQSMGIHLPPLPEQRRIAHILGTLDDKIELNRRMNETLEGMARAVFKDWFVDFGPVRAKMEGREAYLPEDVWGLFPDRLVESELGLVPEGWGVKALDEIANYRNGLALQKFRPESNEERLPVVKIAQLRSGVADGGEWATASITPECIIDDGDVVFSWSGSLLVKVWTAGRAALNQHLFKVTSDKYPKWFYLYYTRHHLAEFQSIAADKTTTMGHIKRQHLREAKCVVPSPEILEAASEKMARLLDQCVSNDVASRRLVELRDSLLPGLVSGEIDSRKTFENGAD